MTRRYLTTEDVLSAQGGEILIGDDTVVTPQALETAESAGITIRTRAGLYREPPPDRGPDASFAMRELPHLPEPPDAGETTSGAVVTAVGRNRPGVLSEITAALASFDASVLDVSQKMIEGYFHLILTVELSSMHSFGEVQTCLQCLGGPEDYAVHVMHERVFRFMHRV
jgi:ACT domain-containing protein